MNSGYVTLSEVFGAGRSRAASLVPETAGFLALAIGDAISLLPLALDEGSILLTTEGTITVQRRGEVLPDRQAASAFRSLLARLLNVSVGMMPGLTAAAQPRDESATGMAGVQREIEAALVPLNRGAARRALARLARETRRGWDSGHVKAEPPNTANASPTPPQRVAPASPSKEHKAAELDVAADEAVVSPVAVTSPAPPPPETKPSEEQLAPAIAAAAYTGEPPVALESQPEANEATTPPEPCAPLAGSEPNSRGGAAPEATALAPDESPEPTVLQPPVAPTPDARESQGPSLVAALSTEEGESDGFQQCDPTPTSVGMPPIECDEAPVVLPQVRYGASRVIEPITPPFTLATLIPASEFRVAAKAQPQRLAAAEHDAAPPEVLTFPASRADELIRSFGGSCANEEGMRAAAACLRSLAGVELPEERQVPVRTDARTATVETPTRRIDRPVSPREPLPREAARRKPERRTPIALFVATLLFGVVGGTWVVTFRPDLLQQLGLDALVYEAPARHNAH